MPRIATLKDPITGDYGTYEDGVETRRVLAAYVQREAPLRYVQREDPLRVSSTADERTVNNVVRHEYRVLSEAEKKAVTEIKDAGLALIALIGSQGPGREFALAKTNVEQAVMWAVKGLTS